MFNSIWKPFINGPYFGHYHGTATILYTLINDNSLSHVLWTKKKKKKQQSKRDNLICLFALILFFAHFMANLWHQQIRQKRAGAKFACKLSAKCAFQIDLRYERLENCLEVAPCRTLQDPIEFQMPKMQSNCICICNCVCMQLRICIYISLELPAVNWCLISLLFYFV